MKNLFYKKIQTSERLPDKDGKYLCKVQGYSNFEYYAFRNNKFYTSFEIVEWLEEIPNREEELADLLQDAINYLDDTKWEDHQFETLANFIMNAQNIVWEIKNNAPKLLDDE